ncbi:unnamed protein product [Bursaphelenchus okinawaensis]|uniref:Acetyl-CoA carboxylase n=1 Tax=Bursaphelenchus okinawaensis TaxID=465554 RepID=A0A811KNY7_9BILA|nr:unnamed protein product [Bursaphelenchus okinawaensis]CAG9107005.1 unnamed protein product [Bursaphelenchus okinawaensis]
MTGPTTSKMLTYRLSKTESSPMTQFIDQQSQTYNTIEDYVNSHVEDPSKARHIKKILVATNGIAAVKCLVSIRKRMMNLFKDDHIIRLICMTTDQEIASQAEYLKYADHFTIAPAGANTNNYANVDEIISHAVMNGVDAVWAGWGHASENPRLPEELAKHNIVFIGPPADAMFALGDKIASTIIAQTVKIPTIEWSGSGLVVNESGEGAVVNIPADLYKQACVYNVEEGLKCLKEKNITYPIMIKASEGGGGKGIRKCNNDEEFRINFRRVQTEVPGSPIFLMKCLMNARHIEVQLIADQYGQVVPFFTRDCSIQRRCQKIIEEAPAGIAPKEVLRQMQQDAVNLAKKVGYVSAGTVEYMYLPESKKYYFLELNPRLQVEHPCTEMISNINIPAIQLQVAMGIPLHRIDEIRLFFGMNRYGKSPLPEDQIRTDVNICVIAARITSEDPSDQFRPASGKVVNLEFQSNQNVWGYFSVSAAGQVHEFADSQFGHLFAKGSTRHEAIAAMTCALKELRLRSTFPSQINYLVGLLNDEDFQRNNFHTGWLDARIQNNIQSVPELPVNVTLAVGATVIGHAKIAEVFSKFQSAIERGQILPTSELTETFELELVHNNVKYSVMVNRYGPINFLVKLSDNDSEICTEVRELGHESLLVTYSDQSYTCHLEEEVERYKVNIGRSLTIFEKENDPSVLRSRNAGRLLQYLVKDGEMIEKGETYAEMESMKMVINLEVKKAGGRLVHVARPGQALFPGTLIARLDDQGDMSSSRPEKFEGEFEEWNQAEERKQLGKVRLNVRFEQLIQACTDVLDGYAVPELLFKQRKNALVDELFTTLENQALPYNLFKVMLNVVETKINKIGTYNKIKELISKETVPFPADELADEIENYLATLDPIAAAADQPYFEPLLNICAKFKHNLKGHKKQVLEGFLTAYHNTEIRFQEVSYDKGVNNIKEIESNPQAVVRKVYSHTRITAKNEFLKEIIRRLDNNMIIELQKPLKRVANLFNRENEPLALFIRETLNKIHQNKDYGQIYAAVTRRSSEKSLQDLVTKCSTNDGARILEDFMTNVRENQLVLHEFFFTNNKQTNSYAIKLFIQNTFFVNEAAIEEIKINFKQNTAIFKFELLEDNPLFDHHHANNKKAVYFLSVLPELDLLKSEKLLNVLKTNVEPQAQNTFLFVALPTGQNGYAQYAKYAEKELRRRAKELRNEVADRLKSHGSVDLMISRAGSPPLYTHYDFSANEKLEIYRLPEEKTDISVENSPYMLFRHNVGRISRVFVRYLLRDVKTIVTPERHSTQTPLELLQEKIVDVIDGACGELRVQVAANSTGRHDKNRVFFDCHHLMIALEYDSRVKSTEGFWKAAKAALQQCEQYLIRNRITQAEIVYQDVSGLAATKRAPGSVRVLYSNETGTISDIGVYRVRSNELESIREGFARFAKQNAYAPYKEIERVKVQEKRYLAREQNTTYVYDYPVVISRAVLDLWKQYEKSDPTSYPEVYKKLPGHLQTAIKNGDSRPVATAHELVIKHGSTEIKVLDEEEMLKRSTNGTNERGMIAWIFDLYTPDAPQGKQIIVIANDITHQHGSFSMAEHELYQKAGEYGRQKNLPRLYIASNSGARIGYAEDIKAKVMVGFENEEKPEEGCSHLYIKKQDATKEILDQIEYEVKKNGDYKINHIIGRERDIGVENLVGSGLIAGESSRAYEEIPTYCLVTGRAVGIGAYVARLLHRVVQVDNSPLILTGMNALNSLLGKTIYTSNGQLGGPQIMYNNGVSTAVVQSDLQGVRHVLNQMSYLSPEMEKDDKERDVESSPRKGPYDVIQVLDCPEGGLFDHGSFEETVGGWARTIRCGRARLRGLHVGVICTETNTVDLEIPADPAADDSQARLVHQAGQVWYPDSAHKTSDLINDFNREKLPLIILANIRGFSGGQKDMYEMVLKFGAQIVDGLQQYTQPVIIYLPPYGELRGGAWAVLDTNINKTCITMLADPLARAGVLEPSGIVEIKFRPQQFDLWMSRNDGIFRELVKRYADLSLDKVEKAAAKAAVEKRRELLMPTFKDGAIKFSDMHDTTPRLLAVGAIHDEVMWRDSRNYFYNLLQVQLSIFRMARRYATEGLGVNEADIRIRHLDEAKEWTLNHLNQNGIKFHAKVTAAKYQRTHRLFDYQPEQIVKYESSDKFQNKLKVARRERLLREIMRDEEFAQSLGLVPNQK